jgi:hypothetical protein
MKKSLMFIALLITAHFNAQEAGKVGEKITNEITVQTPKATNSKAKGKTVTVDKTATEKGNNGNTYGNPNGNPRGNSQPYNWNYDDQYGYAEVFIRIPENGVFSVTLDNQNMTLGTGKFRFFEVRPGNNLIQISLNGRTLFKSRINVGQNKRLILDYFTWDGLYLLQTVNLRNFGPNQDNYCDMWDHMWNDNYNGFDYDYGNDYNPYYGIFYGEENNHNHNTNQDPYNEIFYGEDEEQDVDHHHNNDANHHHNPNNQNNSNNNYNQGNNNNQGYNNNNQNQGNYNNPHQGNPQNQGNYGNNYVYPMPPNDFANFKNTVKQQSFDDTKFQMIKAQPLSTWYTAAQIKELMELFSFDDDRVDVAKYTYDHCVDPYNFYITYTALTFDANKNELMEYVANRGRK